MSFLTVADYIQMGELGKSKRQRRRDANNAIARAQGYDTMEHLLQANAAARAAAAAAPPPPPPPPIDMTQQAAANLPAPIAPIAYPPGAVMPAPIPLSPPSSAPAAAMPVPTGGGQPGSPAYSGGSTSVDTTEDVYTPGSDMEVENQDPLSDAPPPDANPVMSQADAEAYQNAFVESQTSHSLNQTSMAGLGRFRSRSLHRFRPNPAHHFDRETNPHHYRRIVRKRGGIIRHMAGLGQVFASAADAKAKAAQLLKISDTSLEPLWQKALVQKKDPLDGSIIITDDQVSYVKASAAWITQANAALSAMDPNDPDPVIDQLTSAVGVIIERRQQLTSQGVGMGSPLSSAASSFVTSLVNNINSAISKASAAVSSASDPSKELVPSWLKWGAGIYLGIRLLEAMKK